MVRASASMLLLCLTACSSTNYVVLTDDDSQSANRLLSQSESVSVVLADRPLPLDGARQAHVSGDSLTFSYRGLPWTVATRDLVEIRRAERPFNTRRAVVGMVLGSIAGGVLAARLGSKDSERVCSRWVPDPGCEDVCFPACAEYKTVYNNKPHAVPAGVIVGIPVGAAILGFIGRQRVTIYRFRRGTPQEVTVVLSLTPMAKTVRR